MEITRTFITKKRGRVVEDKVKLNCEDADREAFIKKAEDTYWLKNVGEENVLAVRKVQICWGFLGKFTDHAHNYFEVTTPHGVACFLGPENDPLGFIGNDGGLHVTGIYVGKDWKGRRGQVMPWLRAQPNPSGRKNMIPTDNEKKVPGQCMAAMVQIMRDAHHPYRAVVRGTTAR